MSAAVSASNLAAAEGGAPGPAGSRAPPAAAAAVPRTDGAPIDIWALLKAKAKERKGGRVPWGCPALTGAL